MAIVAGVNRLSIVGTGPSGEIFDTSFWVEGPVVASNTQANALAEAAATHFIASARAALLNLIYSDYVYRSIRAYCYPSGGPAASFIGEHSIGDAPGTASSPSLPLQTAMVASLRTGSAGRRHRGRMYLPASGAPITNHQFQSTNVNNVSAGMAAFFTALNADVVGATVHIVSQVGGGAVTPVTAVIVDAKPDIQRRRADKLVAASTTSTDVTT